MRQSAMQLEPWPALSRKPPKCWSTRPLLMYFVCMTRAAAGITLTRMKRLKRQHEYHAPWRSKPRAAPARKILMSKRLWPSVARRRERMQSIWPKQRFAPQRREDRQLAVVKSEVRWRERSFRHGRIRSATATHVSLGQQQRSATCGLLHWQGD